jgi:Sulfotransferase domain
MRATFAAGEPTMTLKVIGAGYGRTGTLSTCTALNQLGFPCYHMFEVIENKANKTHLDFWRGVANTPAGTRHDWESILSKYTAAVDNPACCVWRELMEAYPEAKVLLTLHPRGPEAWYESTIDTIYFTENRWQFKVLKLVAPFIRKMGDMSHKLIWQRNHKGTMNDRGRAIAEYEQHIEDVKAAVPANKLLIFTVDQGWEPLCKFLGVPVPAEPFPNVNDRAQVKKVIAGMAVGAYVTLAIGAIILAGLVYGATRLLG